MGLGLGLPRGPVQASTALWEAVVGADETPAGMPPATAFSIAEGAHRQQTEPSGRPYLDHVRRVAAAVPPEAVSVAWLHDTLEHSDVTEDGLRADGLAPHESAALRLLTRRDGAGDRNDAAFLAHVRVIAAAPGPAGRIARAVKHADMEDRMRLPRDPAAAWRPPYREALALLAREGADR